MLLIKIMGWSCYSLEKNCLGGQYYGVGQSNVTPGVQNEFNLTCEVLINGIRDKKNSRNGRIPFLNRNSHIGIWSYLWENDQNYALGHGWVKGQKNIFNFYKAKSF